MVRMRNEGGKSHDVSSSDCPARWARASQPGRSRVRPLKSGKDGPPEFHRLYVRRLRVAFSEPCGNPVIRTSNLTELAADGVRFTHASNASPNCGPSRTAMLTAFWPARNGADSNHKPPKPGAEVGLPGVLHAIGL